VLNPALNPTNVRPAPTDAERVRALAAASSALIRVTGEDPNPGALAAKRLADALTKLSNADAGTRMQVEAMLVRPLKIDLEVLREALQAKLVTIDRLPDDLLRDWLTADGRTQVVVTPKGDPSDTENLRNFARAVLAVEPAATGPAVAYLESGQTVVRAFLEAGFWALLSIAILLWIVLRRLGDVLLTLIPLLLAGALTLEICVLIDLPMNFANIIALPLLLGVGVAFKIYYVMAWRAGQTSLLQSSLTRAVIFSAATTATAFGSLWFSSHPGTSSMGKLLALSLMCTLAAAVLFQPALMGRPRVIKAG
jgi:predicted RND superfamily exporter protein